MSSVERWSRIPSTAAWSAASLCPAPASGPLPSQQFPSLSPRQGRDSAPQAQASTHLDDEGVALAPASTKGGGPDAAATGLQRIDQVTTSLAPVAPSG